MLSKVQYYGATESQVIFEAVLGECKKVLRATVPSETGQVILGKERKQIWGDQAQMYTLTAWKWLQSEASWLERPQNCLFGLIGITT